MAMSNYDIQGGQEKNGTAYFSQYVDTITDIMYEVRSAICSLAHILWGNVKAFSA